MLAKTRTTQTYNQIAERFLERNRDRGRIKKNVVRFAQHLTQGSLVLDIGCGPGFDAKLLRDLGFRVVGIELSSQMIEVGKCHFPGLFVQADMEHLPFKAIADGLWVNASFLHVERDVIAQTLREFHAVLRPKGVIFINVKEGSGEGWEYGPYDETLPRWFTYWQAKDLECSLTSNGFRSVDFWSNGTWIKCCALREE
jgi:SAM-dependent methyltransferase